VPAIVRAPSSLWQFSLPIEPVFGIGRLASHHQMDSILVLGLKIAFTYFGLKIRKKTNLRVEAVDVLHGTVGVAYPAVLW
jgi:hypothetical protein